MFGRHILAATFGLLTTAGAGLACSPSEPFYANCVEFTKAAENMITSPGYQQDGYSLTHVQGTLKGAYVEVSGPVFDARVVSKDAGAGIYKWLLLDICRAASRQLGNAPQVILANTPYGETAYTCEV